MIKLVGSNPWRGYAISRVLRSVFFSAEAHLSSSPQKGSLFNRISGFGDPNVSVTPLLDQWFQEGRRINHTGIQKLIRQLRKCSRYSQALQVQEWMISRPNYDPNSAGISIQLDLISKVHGIHKAEDYFNGVPVSSRDDKVHGAMLNCYVEKKSMKKAKEFFQKMTEMGLVKSALTYNVMLALYSRMGKNKKFDSLIQEMEDNGIEGDTYTFNIRLSAYANSDLEKMEKLLANVEADSQVTVDFRGYSIAAKGYMKHGLTEKALMVVKKAEKMISKIGDRVNYEHLMTLYSETGTVDEVYRVWNLYKNMGKVCNTGYLSMLSSLLKLEDIEGAEKIFEEWESRFTGFDYRIENLFITAYCKKGILVKAFERVERVRNRGHKLEAGVWQCIATQCCVDGLMDKAVETMKQAILGRGAKSKLNHSTLASCLEYLKKEGDVEAAHEILGFLRERGYFSDVCDRLVDFVKSDRDSGARAAMKEGILKKNYD